MTNIIHQHIIKPKDIAPLITFRILFGGLMMVGALRFMVNGWIEKLYLKPTFFFKYFGFEWVQPLGEVGTYALFSLIALSAMGIMLGLFYRISTIIFFITFTYSELLDATNYLNHYYLVCLLAFLLIFLPANRAFSIDVKRNPSLQVGKIPAWTINILIFQLAVVYTFAGIAKLNYDWLFNSMPLAIWLPERADMPVLGYFFQFKATAYLFSWFGAFYDLTVAYFLLNKKTRPFAYAAVIIFHVFTKLLFNIGLFPFIMIFSTLIFFPAAFHNKWLSYIGYKKTSSTAQNSTYKYSKLTNVILRPLFIAYIALQILMPLRHWLYPSPVLWSEEGYRLSWRVMLVEKSGLVTFHIKDPKTGRQTEIVNGNYLTLFQEKQMSIQPDFILQFAHFLKKEYQQKHGIENPIITADAHVALNGRASQRYIDPTVNLAEIEPSLRHKKWVLQTTDIPIRASK